MTQSTDKELEAIFRGLEDVDSINPSRNPHREAAVAPGTQRPADAHDCFECNGTGFYRGHRVHQEKTHCFACKGKGWHKTSYADRFKARKKAADRKASKKEEAQAAYIEANPGLIEGLRDVVGWSEFAASLLSGFEKWDSLTDKQAAAARAHLAKIAAGRAERAKEKDAKSGSVDVSVVKDLFERIQAKGTKKPQFVFEGLTISPAPAAGRNAGALYVKSKGIYCGKIVGDTLHATREAPANIKELIEGIPSTLEEAIKYGRETGKCACCGRPLTDPKSVARGIGPVCANWFA